MNMSFLDLAIVIGFLIFVIAMGYRTKKYAGNVANFLAAGRCAGRYLIAVAGGVAGWGAISAVAAFEMYYRGGFSIQWWFLLMMVANLIASLSGWIIYRFRQTRALTVAQFLEQRYSRRFRIFAGILCWFSGIMNFGLFPAVGARFFVYFCGLPETVSLAGLNISTYAIIMFGLLTLVLYLLFTGGQIAVIVTDFFQGLFCNIIFIILMVALAGVFTWSQITEALNMAPQGQSMIHPFEAAKTPDFNMWFYIIGFFSLFYTWVVGGGTQGFEVAAINPHEARMGKILNNWRAIAQQLILIILPLCAFTFLRHPDFANFAEKANALIANVHGHGAVETETLQKQMAVPIAMSIFLTKGLIGAVCAIILAAFIANHQSYMHSWGIIFIQDVVMPLYKKPLTPKQHINLLRWSILGVAVFIFLFGLIYRQNEYLLMFMVFTGTIYLGGAGAAVIGGLYWKRGTTAGAWTAMIFGLIIAFAGQIIRRIWPEFPLNSNWVFAIAIAGCSFLYVVVSLLGKKQVDMDQLLHRGKYAISDDAVALDKTPVTGLKALIAMGPEFTFWDKVVYLSSIGWTLLLCAVFVIGTILNFVFKVQTQTWTKFWWVYILVMFVLSVLTTIWFIVGGIRDYVKMFALLKVRKSDERDDGRVFEHLGQDKEKNEKVSAAD
ncbi:MAG: hypothetical protein A2Y12_13595 [Planctomycetes bacterium GWF2_42_9]|nr:MAG: hypothetical protein A2Y12_13595 [Planctomycetes bacterium GWF2_42_9]